MNLDIGLLVEQLKGAIRPWLSGEAKYQEVVLDATNRRGKSIKCHITCTPLMTSNREHQGVILMMEEMEK